MGDARRRGTYEERKVMAEPRPDTSRRPASTPVQVLSGAVFMAALLGQQAPRRRPRRAKGGR